MVDRYKKTGGFLQLVQVIETCNTKKYEQFMKIISEENPEWAEALIEKCLTFDKIISWKAEVILEVIASVNMLSFTAALKCLTPEKLEIFLQKLSNQDQKKFELALQEAKPNPNEISSSVIKVISETRLLFVQGSLKADKIDQQLVIPDGYESMLGKNEQSRQSGTVLSFEVPSTPAVNNLGGVGGGSSLNAEFDKIQKRIVSLSREVQALKSENQIMKDKLEKIKKIA